VTLQPEGAATVIGGQQVTAAASGVVVIGTGSTASTVLMRPANPSLVTSSPGMLGDSSASNGAPAISGDLASTEIDDTTASSGPMSHDRFDNTNSAQQSVVTTVQGPFQPLSQTQLSSQNGQSSGSVTIAAAPSSTSGAASSGLSPMARHFHQPWALTVLLLLGSLPLL